MARGHFTRTPRESFHTTSRLVSYARVSTIKQGISGLGLEAQQAAIDSYLRGAKPVGEFIEVESGRKNDRPELMKALALCRKEKATLIIAKLDRLSRTSPSSPTSWNRRSSSWRAISHKPIG